MTKIDWNPYIVIDTEAFLRFSNLMISCTLFNLTLALATECARFESFPPGHIYTSKTGTFTRWYKPDWMEVRQ
jgi:hypothetical protein